MKTKGLNLKISGDVISSVKSGGQILHLLASSNGVEIMKQDIKKGISFDIYPAEDGKSFLEFFYVLDGVIEYIDSSVENKTLLKPGDYFYVNDLQNEVLFKTLTDVSLLYITTEEVFKDIQDAVSELSKLKTEVKEKDKYTLEHSERVKDIAVAIAIDMKLEPKKVANIAIASLSHDIGKINIPDEILFKPTSLTNEEYDLVKDHASSKELLKGIKNEDIVKIVEQHHEHIDGSGYPMGLKGDEICIEAKIISVADAFDAMTSRRVYSDAKTKEEAMVEIAKFSGKLYDRKVVSSFIKIINENI